METYKIHQSLYYRSASRFSHEIPLFVCLVFCKFVLCLILNLWILYLIPNYLQNLKLKIYLNTEFTLINMNLYILTFIVSSVVSNLLFSTDYITDYISDYTSVLNNMIHIFSVFCNQYYTGDYNRNILAFLNKTILSSIRNT